MRTTVWCMHSSCLRHSHESLLKISNKHKKCMLYGLKHVRMRQQSVHRGKRKAAVFWKSVWALPWHFFNFSKGPSPSPVTFPASQTKTCCRFADNNQTSVTQSGTRYLPHSTYSVFSKHVCLQWLNPLRYYGTKSPPDPPKNRLLKALFMSGLWGESNRPKDRVDRGFSTCYHWGHLPKDPIGQRLNKSPSTAD